LVMRMPDDHRPPGSDVVDVGVAVGVGHRAAAGALDEARHAAHRLPCAHRAVHAAGNVAVRFGEELLRRLILHARVGVTTAQADARNRTRTRTRTRGHETRVAEYESCTSTDEARGRWDKIPTMCAV